MAAVAELGADDRELLERRVKDRVPRLGVTLQHETEDGHEQQQQWEQGKEPEVGDQRRLVAGLIVGELLQHRDRDGGRPVAPLEAVKPAHRTQDIHDRSATRDRARSRRVRPA